MKRIFFKSNNLKLFFVILLIVLLDQVTKTWAYLNLQGRNAFGHPNDIIIIKNAFRLTYVENPGMAFGIRIGNELYLTLFATVSSFLLLIIIFKLNYFQKYYKYALGCILGGAIGNLIDRFIHGIVIDFIYFEAINWPVFNIADIAVTLGMILGVVQIFFSNDETITSSEEDPYVWLDGEKTPSDKVIQ
jgi:signal peptidase II